MTFNPNDPPPMSARTDYEGCELIGSGDGQILYRPPTETRPWFFATGVADPSPETTAAIRRIQAELDGAT